MADITEIFGTEGLSEELKSQVQEAWENKLSEAREDISAELREEFAQRYENDKSQIVEAMDNMKRVICSFVLPLYLSLMLRSSSKVGVSSMRMAS